MHFGPSILMLVLFSFKNRANQVSREMVLSDPEILQFELILNVPLLPDYKYQLLHRYSTRGGTKGEICEMQM